MSFFQICQRFFEAILISHRTRIVHKITDFQNDNDNICSENPQKITPKRPERVTRPPKMCNSSSINGSNIIFLLLMEGIALLPTVYPFCWKYMLSTNSFVYLRTTDNDSIFRNMYVAIKKNNLVKFFTYNLLLIYHFTLKPI